MKEREIVKRVIAAITAAGGKAVKYHGSPYSHAGTPDVLACVDGRMYALEVKQPGGKPTKLQAQELVEWGEAGAVASVVTSAEDVESLRREAARMMKPLDYADFNDGVQPCDNFAVGEFSELSGKPVVYPCDMCEGRLMLCANCGEYHHEGGYEDCAGAVASAE
jgi:Holliday junction resolvase